MFFFFVLWLFCCNYACQGLTNDVRRKQEDTDSSSEYVWLFVQAVMEVLPITVWPAYTMHKSCDKGTCVFEGYQCIVVCDQICIDYHSV